MDLKALTPTEKVSLHARGLARFSNIFAIRPHPDDTVETIELALGLQGGRLVHYDGHMFAIMERDDVRARAYVEKAKILLALEEEQANQTQDSHAQS